ncbi:hypothetical protein UFOVP999_14 [uncultured Caudovirales phage]|uniref:Uncharacterized protein n=1 Tax=uncultured Caudovirales phage TaxID=2100421 RepID=A0A6J5PZ39_9CAUD|nr:hypothetical protein UFOVP999_14 [uncultured Caudovirales phage]
MATIQEIEARNEKLVLEFSGSNPKYAASFDPSVRSWTLRSVAGYKDPNGVEQTNSEEVFLYVDKDGSYDVLNIDEIVNRYEQVYSRQPGGLQAFKKRLWQAGQLTDQEYKSTSSGVFKNAIVNAARDHSSTIASNYANANAKFEPIDSFLVANKEQSAGPEINRKLTDPKQAVQDLNIFTQDYLSRTATLEEQKEYKKLLRAEEISAYQKRVTTKTGNVTSTDYIGDVLNQEDYMRIMGKVLKKSIAGTDVDQLLTGTGTLAQNVSAIREYASEMGIKMDGKEALNYATSNLKSGDMKNINNIDSVKLQIKEMAKYLYPSLAAGIDAGVTPGRIGREVGGYIEDELEQPAGTYGIFNSEVADFVAKGTPQNEIRAAQRKKKEFAGTDKAINEATNYLDTMLKSFGVL